MSEQQKRSEAMRYIGLGTQLMVLMGIGTYGGYKLDERLGFRALFVILFPVIGLVYSLWQLLKAFNRK